MKYPSGEKPCKCCGIPIGPTSAAAKHGGKCFDCAPISQTKVFDRTTTHNSITCAQDRDSVIKLYTRMCNGEITQDATVTMPSGRRLVVQAPEAVAV